MYKTKRYISKDSHSEKPQLTGSKLRSYAYALLARKEYSKAELTQKLQQYAQDLDEVHTIIEQMIEYNYQNDERYAQQMFRSQLIKGQGPQRIKHKIQQKSVDVQFIEEQLESTNWLAEAYKLKVRKFGEEVATDPKMKAKQIRFLQYRGYSLDIIFKVIEMKITDEIDEA
ncbi:regulatory protein RecX [Acinetobacter sp. B5B]|uniref:regulatory protein RecX n=1 Tax=Acinetobacter baretiae TaxID=2605383 RepID=UPI0018C265A9|nr:regulatory protein RecX [Acinetobacter baretiae]MBF7682480.1 regulatory protein RecX [Acinetobacter baretiae]MBF7685253.1 regulatory protein RecX [Acinetobacter baretiae]